MMAAPAVRPPPRPWQAKEFANRHAPKRALFCDPRLGKTRAIVDAWDDLRPARAIVTCPIKVGPFWAEQLRERGFAVVEAYAHTTAWLRLNMPKSGGVIVINDDKISTCKDVLLRWKPDALAVDESHRLKSPVSQRGKAVRALARIAPWVRILTGTPAPNHYGDLWGQMACLDPVAFGTWKQFESRFLVVDPYFHNRVLGHRNEDELQAMMMRYATIVRREDVFGPDEYQRVTRTVQLEPSVQDLYDTLATKWVLADLDVEALTLLTRLIRLQQLSSGFLKDQLGNEREIHRSKVDAVQADLGEIMAAREKVVLFHRFTWESTTYEALARKMCPSVFVINGAVTAKHADEAIRAFRACPGPAIAIVQTQAGGTGVDFATATHAMFVSDGFSFADRKQAEDRIYSPGKCRVITTYVAEGTIDEFVGEVLAAKGDIAHAVRHADRASMAFGHRKNKK